MTHRVRILAALSVAIALPLLAPAQEPEEHAFVDEVKKDFLDKIERHIADSDWKALFDTYDYALVKYGQKLVRPDPAKQVWIGLLDHLGRRFRSLPPTALEFYRAEYDGRAQAAWSRAREERNPAAMAEVAERWFFASNTDVILDTLGNQAFEDRQTQQALHFWRRLLEYYPDSEIPRHVTTAKVAQAWAALGNQAAVDALRRWTTEQRIEGDLVVAGRPIRLSSWLASLKTGVDAAPLRVRPPVVPEGEARLHPQGTQLRNDVRLWSFDFGSPAEEQPNFERPVRRWPQQNPGLANYKELPYFPAYTVARGKGIVVMTDGRKVLAVESGLVRSSSPTVGRLWTEEVKRNPNDPRGGAVGGTQVGATADGEHVYVTLASEKRVPATDPAMTGDTFDGPSRLVCFNALTGRRIWDTDIEKLHAAWRKLEFYDRNWAFSTPPIVAGGMLYAPICTSPSGESESRVACIDKTTGELRWTTFVASVPMMQARFGGMVAATPLLTQVIERGGALYVQTNLGIVASLQAATGQIRWLAGYPHRAPWPNPMTGQAGLEVMRPSDPPILYKGRLYVLPQDQLDLLVFDAATGERLRWVPRGKPANFDSDLEDISWKSTLRLVGIADDWVITGGISESYWITLIDRFSDRGVKISDAGRAFSFSYNFTGGGRSLVKDDLVYLSCHEPEGRSLVVSALDNVKRIFKGRWKDEKDHGNLLLAGDRVVVAGERGVAIYVDSETLKGEFARRTRQEPADPQAWDDYATLMQVSDLLADAADGFQKFIDLAQPDPARAPRIREVRTNLYSIFMKQGLAKLEEAKAKAGPEEPAKGKASPTPIPTPTPTPSKDPATLAEEKRKAAEERRKALEGWEETVAPFETARRFAPDEDARSEATRCLALGLELAARTLKEPEDRLRYARRAAGEYHAVVGQPSRAVVRQPNSEVLMRARVHAANRIAAIAKLHGPDGVEPIAQKARAALDAARDRGHEALAAVAVAFPRLPSAGEALDQAAGIAAKEGAWRAAITDLKDLRRDFPERWTPDLARRLIEALERHEDWPRVREELILLDRGSAPSATFAGGSPSIKTFCERGLARVREAAPPEPAPMTDAPRSLAVFEPGQPSLRPAELSTAPLPLLPEGSPPKSFGDGHELIARGSSVELWNVRGGKQLWTAAHPGNYVGITIGLDPATAGVEVREVVADSPASKAGIRAGDILIAADGKALTPATFSPIVDAGRGTIRFQARRREQALDFGVIATPWPASHRPAVLSAAFTAGYAIVVLWEDLAAAFDPADGRLLWSQPCVDVMDFYQGLVVVEDHVLLHEHRRPATPIAAAPEDKPALPERPCRIACLDGLRGELRWMRLLATPAPGEIHSFERVSPPLPNGQVVLLGCTRRGVVTTLSPLSISMADGSDAASTAPQVNSAFDYVVDRERGLLITVDRDTQELRSTSLWSRPDGAEAVRPIEATPLRRHVGGDSTQAGLVANSRLLVLALAPSQNGTASKVVIFSLATGKECGTLPMPDDRSLPMNRSDLLKLEEDGTCYVYVVPKTQVAGGSPASRRGHVQAWKLSIDAVGAAKCELAWEAVAPYIAGQGKTGDAFLESVGGAVVLFGMHSYPPGERGNASIGMLYGKRDGGYLRRVFEDLQAASESGSPYRAPLQILRGRIYTSTKDGLTIWGN